MTIWLKLGTEFPIYICVDIQQQMTKKIINRIRVVLAEKDRANKWLAKQLKVTPVTVSKWCSNTRQPSLETLTEIAKALDVDVCELLNHTKEK